MSIQPGPMTAESLQPDAPPGNNSSAAGQIGVVVIGRNEGERLRRCLESVRGQVACVVYVDSGSTDDSLALAHTLSDAVVELDMTRPFTAARARNEGFQKLLEIAAGLTYVFFVDGDCEVVAGWLDNAIRFLVDHPDFAVAWGLRRERHPEKSIYNLLTDIEWLEYPLGETKYCGGDAVARIEAIRQVNGYRADLICGEEPEMCIRLRQAGWRIFHLQTPMTLHDAAIYRFGQWWKRTLRSGYGFAQGAAIHGRPPERHGVSETRRAWIWGLGIPAIAFILAPTTSWWALLLLGAYPIQIIRIASRGRQPSTRHNLLRAGALVFGKIPEAFGMMKFYVDRLRRSQSGLIEYK
jgi:glycosyltransferase involved in cell wall biosynthesis